MSKENLGSFICSKLLFIHAIIGCDTTSQIVLYWKKTSLSNIQSSDELSKINDIFMQDQASMNNIIKAGENALVILYIGDSGDDLNSLHNTQFQEKVMKNHNYVDASDLLPTS